VLLASSLIVIARPARALTEITINRIGSSIKWNVSDQEDRLRDLQT